MRRFWLFWLALFLLLLLCRPSSSQEMGSGTQEWVSGSWQPATVTESRYRAQSQNFTVDAPTQELAQRVAQYAEHYRAEKAKLWLGAEMPAWREPCPVRVTVTQSGAGGATSFAYNGGQVLGQKMQIEGPTDRLLVSVLPHEVTHTVFAHHFRRPVPRWADEGAAVMSEDETERRRMDRLCRDVLNQGRSIPLKRLFSMTEYPSDVMVLYAEGYAVTNWLVAVGGRSRFLSFVAGGMGGNWEGAAQSHYGAKSVDGLEQQWLQHMRETKGNPLLNQEGGLSPSSPAPKQPASVQPLGASQGGPLTTAPNGAPLAPAKLAPGEVATVSGEASVRMLAALERVERKLDEVDRLKADMVNVKARLDRLEGAGGTGTPPPVAWNNPPERNASPPPLPPVQPTYAQPVSWNPPKLPTAQPLGNYFQIGQPPCLPGRQ